MKPIPLGPVVIEEAKALRYALTLPQVQPLAERLLRGNKVSVAEIGCGISWCAGPIAQIIGAFESRAIRLVGVDPDLVQHDLLGFERTSMSRKTEFIMHPAPIALENIDDLKRLAFRSSFEMVLMFNPLDCHNLIPFMVSLLRRDGLLIVSLANDGLLDHHLESLSMLQGVSEVASVKNEDNDCPWNHHLFIARATGSEQP